MNPLKIINYIKWNNLTKEKFCSMCNITESMLDDIIFYGKVFSMEVAERIADAMGVGIYELYTYGY